MSRVFYLGPPSAVRWPHDVSAAVVLGRMGRNTGNLLIGDAIMRHLRSEKICRLGDLLRREGKALPLERVDCRQIERDFDVIVIGAANFLHGQSDFTAWADLLEAVDLPCVIIGLGAQAPAYDCRVDVPEGTRRLVKIVAERSASLGVRGSFTASVLKEMGILNVRVIGCPSMYWTCRPALELRPRTAAARLAVSVNGSANVVGHSADVQAATRVEAMLARLSFDRDYPYVLQNEVEMMDVLRDAPTARDPVLIDWLARQYGLSDLSPEGFVGFVRRNMKVYSDTSAWMAAIGGCDFVLGSRFHGCLIGLLAGVPSFVLVHDSRTREMCELLGIPHTDVRHVGEIGEIDVRAIYDSLDLEAVQTAYPALYRNYVEFLDENGLDHRLSRA